MAAHLEKAIELNDEFFWDFYFGINSLNFK